MYLRWMFVAQIPDNNLSFAYDLNVNLYQFIIHDTCDFATENTFIKWRLIKDYYWWSKIVMIDDWFP